MSFSVSVKQPFYFKFSSLENIPPRGIQEKYPEETILLSTAERPVEHKILGGCLFD